MGQIKSFSISAQGASHLKINKICQDSSCSLDEPNGKYAIAAVSDGHGGDKYFRSDKGSRNAVEIARTAAAFCMETQVFIDTMSSSDNANGKEKVLSDLEASIVRIWGSAIENKLKEYPITEDEISGFDEDVKLKFRDDKSDYKFRAYGATLIVAVVCEDFWFGFQIGDGTFVVKQNGEYSQPIEIDEKCVGTNTTSICNSNAIKYFHHAWGLGVPEAVFIATDGVDESFATENGLYKFYDNIIKNSCEDWEDNLSELENYLPELSKKGSRDDVSISGIIYLEQSGVVADTPAELDVNENSEKQVDTFLESQKKESKDDMPSSGVNNLEQSSVVAVESDIAESCVKQDDNLSKLEGEKENNGDAPISAMNNLEQCGIGTDDIAENSATEKSEEHCDTLQKSENEKISKDDVSHQGVIGLGQMDTSDTSVTIK
ncbi:hypothetical protein AGMMS49975_08240 [Clostridia bacterium]|nr:hypothetical protein AGMMS49975_08240 [Clostridia bacterium]